jgi:hypothetical protein
MQATIRAQCRAIVMVAPSGKLSKAWATIAMWKSNVEIKVLSTIITILIHAHMVMQDARSNSSAVANTLSPGWKGTFDGHDNLFLGALKHHDPGSRNESLKIEP